jgi:hypothetical protein
VSNNNIENLIFWELCPKTGKNEGMRTEGEGGDRKKKYGDKVIVGKIVIKQSQSSYFLLSRMHSRSPKSICW